MPKPQNVCFVIDEAESLERLEVRLNTLQGEGFEPFQVLAVPLVASQAVRFVVVSFRLLPEAL